MQILVLLLACFVALNVPLLNAGCTGDCSCHGNYANMCFCYSHWKGSICSECDKGSFAMISRADEECSGFGGSASFSITNTYTPALLSLNGSPLNATLSHTNLVPGDYVAKAFGSVDNDHCIVSYSTLSQTISFTIAPATPITATANVIKGGCKGGFSINAFGGSGRFSYSIDGATYGASPTFSELQPGMYTYYVKDKSVVDYACVRSFPVNVTADNKQIDSTCSASAPVCPGGQAQITITSSGASSAYTYAIDNSTYTASNVFSASAGDHTCYVTDGNCYSTSSVIAPSAPAKIQVIATTTNETCDGSGDGSVTFSGSGGTGKISFSFDGQNWRSQTTFSNLTTGTYKYYVKDANNCTTPSSSFIIQSPPVMKQVVVVTNGTCNTASRVTFNVSGGSSSNFSLSFGGKTYQGDNWQLSGLLPGVYPYRITDINQCSIISSITIYPTPAKKCSRGSCDSNAICDDIACEVTCTCKAGYSGNGTICKDINECFEEENGGCDWRVKCTNTEGSRVCGECPDGTVADGPLCKTTCGDGVCNKFENCVSCFADCNTTTCQTCNDGYCDPNIGETCSSCFADCGPCGPQTCQAGCGLHGICVSGLCVCESTWNGPSCSTYQSQPINVTFNSTAPTATINPSNHSDSQDHPNFYISIKNISEINANGVVMRSIVFSTVNFTLNVTQTGLNQVYNYSAVLSNRALVNVILQRFEENSTVISFAKSNTTFPAHTLKLNVIVRQWPFLALANSLSINIDSRALRNDGTQASDSCVSDKQDDSGSLRWMLIVVGNTSLYGQFLDKAVVDGRVRTVSYHLNSDKTISAILPSFWYYADLDPSFSVLIGDETSSQCGTKMRDAKAGVNVRLIEIIVPVVVGSMICAALGVVLFPRAKTWWQLNHVKSAQEMEVDEFKTSYRPDMRAETEAGDFRVKF